jgi:hypothetical protein
MIFVAKSAFDDSGPKQGDRKFHSQQISARIRNIASIVPFTTRWNWGVTAQAQSQLVFAAITSQPLPNCSFNDFAGVICQVLNLV